ncbi:pilin N-terminal domain-containing protein [Finegoldia magna]|uniref:LPXTG-motif cell wall anchor domain protein n=1 Tax=Finegoldia magna ATCC 53516 TaxID=525282 RepID=D6S719_FINMA|nr:pilin N-terminal domain-containing protein [Finegoldia magna]EFH93873.1 LPXTG-motif cell wall anchor domain protein [Finegoldia magna ATCC 53516]
MKKRFLSLIIALAMMVGVFTPLIASAADETTNTVTLHKMLMTKENLKNEKFPGTTGLDGTEYDGNLIGKKEDNKQTAEDIKKALESYFGAGSKEIAGAYFAVKYNSTDNKGKYVTIKKDTKATEKPVYGAVDSLDEKLPEGFELLAGLTEADGIKFTTKGLKGDFLIEEIHEKSSYFNKDKNKDENGKIITDSKAVPVKITLPLVNNNGVVPDAHVYPKNTEEKPQIDKNFKKAEKGETELEKADGFEEAEKGAGIGVGANYENYQKKKATAKAEIGKKIPYEVKTQIPAKSKLKTAYWSDEMTEGLQYNNDLKVTIGGTKAVAGTDYTVTTDKNTNGFRIELTQAGFDKVNGQDKDVEVVLTYSATVKSITVVDIPEANDITFHYGNNKPGEGNTPIPTKPNDNGDLTVKKTWADGTPAKGEWASFKLVNAQTGEEIGTVKFETKENAGKLETTTTYTPNAAYTPIGNEKTITGPETKTEEGNVWSFTWKGLDKELQYKVEEDNNMNQTAHFTKGENGEILITNNKDNNPKPLNPTEPKVVLGGKKFVKTDENGKRLAGAEFFVKKTVTEEGKQVDKYLVATKKDEKEVAVAKAALDKAVEEYNALTAEQQEGQEGKTKKAAIDTAQDAYNKAFIKNATAYTWVNAPKEGEVDNRVVLTSDGQGRFEISGLEYGDYKLEEKTPPKGFAKLNGDIDFKVAKGSYSDAAGYKKGEAVPTHIGYTSDTDTEKGQQIVNKKVTIPQTGGIGTIIFTAIGLAIMASAIIAIKKRQATEAR